MKEWQRLRRSEVLGVRFVAEPFEVVRNAVAVTLRDDARNAVYLCPTGVHGTIEAHKDPHFRDILNGAAFNVADGMPIVRVSRMLGFASAERAFGPEIMRAIIQDSAASGARHFFYGGGPGVAKHLGEVLSESYPGIQVAGSYRPPFRPLTQEERREVVEMVNATRADVVWVGLSTPKQERWIADFRDELDVKLICSVGAAFDYHTGSIRPAPNWMKTASLEWLFRLLQEPRRLWRRYLDIIPRFLFLVTLQIAGHGPYSKRKAAGRSDLESGDSSTLKR